MPDNKKVLFLITKSNWGGAQRYVHDLAIALPKDKYTVSVALGGNGPLKNKLENEGIKVIPIPSLQRDISVKKEILSFWEVYKILKSENPDVLHINSSKAGAIGAFVGRLARIQRIIFTSHAWAFNEDRSTLQKIILKFIHWVTVLLSHHTIVVSKALKKQMNWLFANSKMSVIHNGRPTINFLSKEEARLTLAEKEPRLKNNLDKTWTGSIGELHHVKGHDIMIEALSKLRTFGHYPLHIIISDGELRDELQNLIDSKQMSNHVFLLGSIDEAARYLKAFDYYIQPSRSEALGYTVVEASMAKLPIIASNVGGIPEVITHQKEGLLIPSEDSESLADSLNSLLNNPGQAEDYATEAAKKSNDFKMDTMVEKTIAVYSTSASRT